MRIAFVNVLDLCAQDISNFLSACPNIVDGLDLSADGHDSLLKLCHLDYYNTVFRLLCYSYKNKRLSLLNASYLLNAPLGPLKFK